MTNQHVRALEKNPIETSAPCRIDMGGTLDISTFHYPLRHLSPCTFNIAINLRTFVRLNPYKKDLIKISSKGFESTEFPLEKAPFNHPLGLMFAIASYFGIKGIHIDINSSSPPRSALGGSSAAAVALVAALSSLHCRISKDSKPLSGKQIALLAHAIEESVAGVPCGLQDQLAAVFGGAKAWYWNGITKTSVFTQKTIVKKHFHKQLQKHILLAYCGIPHESKNVNSTWVQQFLSGKNRNNWKDIVKITEMFVKSLKHRDILSAAALMNKETSIRRNMTPEVLDGIGTKLVDAAIKNNCGARFTGAGGGGCIWALGEVEQIQNLKNIWSNILTQRKEAQLLDVTIDPQGLLFQNNINNSKLK